MYVRVFSTLLSVVILTAASIVPFFGLQRAGRSSSSKWSQSSPVANLFNAFASGIFLSTCFLGLMPHLKKNELSLKKLLNETEGGRSTTAEIFVDSNLVTLFGFLLIAVVEKAVHFVPTRTPTSQTKKRTTAAGNGEQTTSLTTNTDGQPLVDLHSESESDSGDDFGRIEFRSAAANNTNGHSHSHSFTPEGPLLQSIVLLFALSTHSIFEGVALGAQTDDSAFLKFLISIMLHEVLCSFAFGVNLATSGVSHLHGVVYILILSLTLPFGMGIMAVVNLVRRSKSSSSFLKFVFEGVAAGTFIYVACLEMLPEQLGHATLPLHAFWNSLALFGGGVVFFVFNYLIAG
ncbi:Zinc transporter ZIP3 [Aphelenchoides fujianensis]|nr:Zinc transporter ZIP3 [Aphelenchoides fujianensis]